MHSQPSDSADLGDLFHAAFRGLRRTWAEQLSPWELTPHQWRALMMLTRPAPGDPMRLKDLAERLRIAPRSATEVVDQLEIKGLVRRDPDPTDRRATLVAATPAGQQLFATISAERRGKSSEYFARLSADDRSELARILGQLGD
jgi:DNA-binding MarR family transcriptional regulator